MFQAMPLAVTGLSSRRLGSETVIFNEGNGAASHLNDTASRIFEACDGKSDRSETESIFGADIVQETLQMLAEADLLVQRAALSRRQLLTRGAFGAGLVVAAPVVVTVLLPSAAAAASSTGSSTTGTTSGTVVTPVGSAPVAVKGVTVQRTTPTTTSGKKASSGTGGTVGSETNAAAPLAFTGASPGTYLEVAGALIATGAAAIAVAGAVDRRNQA